MARVEPLTAAEDEFWRALMRIMLSLPRRLDKQLIRAVGINSNEYLTLMCLSEARRGELRMTELARATGLSASRVTRVVDELEARGLATKRASAEDRRGNVAGLTPDGLVKLESARGVHVSCVRALVFDHVDRATAEDAARALAKVAAGLVGKA